MPDCSVFLYSMLILIILNPHFYYRRPRASAPPIVTVTKASLTLRVQICWTFFTFFYWSGKSEASLGIFLPKIWQGFYRTFKGRFHIFQ